MAVRWCDACTALTTTAVKQRNTNAKMIGVGLETCDVSYHHIHIVMSGCSGCNETSGAANGGVVRHTYICQSLTQFSLFHRTLNITPPPPPPPPPSVHQYPIAPAAMAVRYYSHTFGGSGNPSSVSDASPRTKPTPHQKARYSQRMRHVTATPNGPVPAHPARARASLRAAPTEHAG